jgi:hypothetical protein
MTLEEEEHEEGDIYTTYRCVGERACVRACVRARVLVSSCVRAWGMRI